MSSYYLSNGVVISLADCVAGLKSRFREYLGQNKYKDFDHIPFLTTLLQEIFDPSLQHVVGELPVSTQILMNLQIDKRYATLMHGEAFNAVLDAISQFVPAARAGYRYQLLNPYDLLIASTP